DMRAVSVLRFLALLAAMAMLAAACSGSSSEAGQGGDASADDQAATEDETAPEPASGEATDGSTTSTADGEADADQPDDEAVGGEAAEGDSTEGASTEAPAEPQALAPSSGEDYLETFDGPESIDTLDFYISNGRDYNNRPVSWPADHAVDGNGEGGVCGTPDTTRTISWPDPPGNDTPVAVTEPGEVAYWCAPGGEGSGHLMTAFNTGGYAHLDFSPRQLFSDVRRVCFDINTTNLGNRQWAQVVIVDADLAAEVAPRLDWTHPHFRNQGPASWGLEITEGVFIFMSIQGGAEVMTGGGASAKGNGKDLSVSDPKKRTTTCLTDRGSGEIEVSQERWSGTVDVSTLPGAFPRGDVRVIFQDVTYNAQKAVNESPPAFDGFTWHWDNLFVSSSADG
ncbi:MAG: hypothetical protein AAFO29_20265, partial [Actinomycetota bacterium]